MSREYVYEEWSTRRPRRDSRDSGDDRDDSPDHHRRGSSRRPDEYDERPRTSDPRLSNSRVEEDGFVRETMTLAPPRAQSRPRSVPPNSELALRRRDSSRDSARSRRDRDLAYSYDSEEDDRYRRDRGIGRRDRSRDRSESPLEKARNVVQENFTNSTTGIGASLLGAVAGGFAARELSSAHARRSRDKNGRRNSDADKEDKLRLWGTIAGAVVGGMGANALANRVEESKVKGKADQHAWESKWGREEDLPHWDNGRYEDRDHRTGKGLRRQDSYDDYDDYDDGYYNRSGRPSGRERGDDGRGYR